MSVICAVLLSTCVHTHNIITSLSHSTSTFPTRNHTYYSVIDQLGQCFNIQQTNPLHKG